MSLWSPDAFFLHLGPDYVQFAERRGLKRRLVAIQHLALPDSSRSAGAAALRVVSSGAPLRELIDEALSWLAGRSPAPLHLTISDHYARYLMQPPLPGLRDAAEAQAIARMSFDEVYGRQSHQAWRIVNSQQAPWKPGLNCALPEELVAMLETRVSAAGLKIATLRPRLVVAAAAMARQMPASGWMISHEAGRVGLLGWHQHAWQAVHSQKVGGDSAAQVLAVARRQLILAGAGWDLDGDARKLLICAPSIPQSAWPQISGRECSFWSVGSTMTDQLDALRAGDKDRSGTCQGFGDLLLGIPS